MGRIPILYEPTLCIPQLNITGEKSHKYTDWFYFKFTMIKTSDRHSTLYSKPILSYDPICTPPKTTTAHLLLSSNFPWTPPAPPTFSSCPSLMHCQQMKDTVDPWTEQVWTVWVHLHRLFSLNKDYSPTQSMVGWICGYQTEASNLIILHPCLNSFTELFPWYFE